MTYLLNGQTIQLLVVFILSFISLMAIGRFVWKTERYELQQSAALSFALPMFMDKELWHMNEDGQNVRCEVGAFTLTAVPAGFNRRYRITLWMDDEKGRTDRLLQLVFTEKGCIDVDLSTCLIKPEVLDELMQMPFHQTVEYVLQRSLPHQEKS